jgi:biopolymer transport protein ExbD
MTDIVFLLLLFFMLSVSFAPPIGLTIDLPSSHHANPITNHTKVSITASLAYYVADEPIDRIHLKEALSSKLSSTPKLVFLQVDKSVPVQNVIEVVDIANGLQAQVSVATQPE